MGNRLYGKKYANGGELGMDEGQDRAMPVADSAKTDGAMSLMERMALGNKDQQGSKAYNTVGAGRDAGIANSDARMLRRGADTSADSAAPSPAPAPAKAVVAVDTSDTGSDTGRGAAGTSETTSAGAAAPSPAPAPRSSKARAQPAPSRVDVAPVKRAAMGVNAIPIGKYDSQTEDTAAPQGLTLGSAVQGGDYDRGLAIARAQYAKEKAARTGTQLAGYANGGAVGGRLYGKK